MSHPDRNTQRITSTVLSALRGIDVPPSSYILARWLFLRLLGLVFLIAFISMWVQNDGLIGRHGILPVEDYLERAHAVIGATAYWAVPSLCWIDAGPVMLHGLCAAGTTLAVLVMLGVAPGPILLLLWVTYLSLVTVGQDFYSFQWDILLLETAFLAMFFVSWSGRCRLARPTPESRAGRWLLWLLLFKLMVLSGVTKLLSGDLLWANLSALSVHYETQPLPTWVGWHAHQLPAGWQKFSVGVMFIIEIGLPMLIVAPRRLRHLSGVGLVLFQAAIAATGNYCFFNCLTIVLCVPLFDDHLLRRLIPARFIGGIQSPPTSQSRPVRRILIVAVALAVALASIVSFFDEMVSTWRRQQKAVAQGAELAPIPAGIATVLDLSDRLLLSWGKPKIQHWIIPFRTINGYGLFRSMTNPRPELIIEGSIDGSTWKAYEFRWKPGDVKRRPRYVAPHQPRLDWQMWFAALNPRGSRWLIPLLDRILDGSPQVLNLLANNPFPDRPPRHIRLVLYEYRFTDAATRRSTGAWWQRKLLGRFQSRSATRREPNLNK